MNIGMEDLARGSEVVSVVFLHMKYNRYIITMMSVPYIGNIW
jgi:hypothetical protein